MAGKTVEINALNISLIRDNIDEIQDFMNNDAFEAGDLDYDDGDDGPDGDDGDDDQFDDAVLDELDRDALGGGIDQTCYENDSMPTL